MHNRCFRTCYRC